MANYQILMDFQDGNGYIDYSSQLTGESFTRTLSVGDIGTHEISNLSITLKSNNQFFRKYLQTNTPIKLKVFKDGNAYFKGIIRPNADFTIEEKLRNVSLEVIDNSYLLEVKPTETYFWTNLVVCDNANPSTSLIHKLLEVAVIPSTDYSITIYEPAEITVFKLEPTNLISNVMEQVLFEYGLNYYFDVDGTFLLKNVSPDLVTPLINFNNSNIIQPLEITKEERLEDGCVITCDSITYKPNQLIYRGISNQDSPINITGNLYHPANGNTKDIFQKFSLVNKEEDEKLFYSLNHSLVITKDEEIIISKQNYFPEQAQILFKNTSTELKAIRQFDIRADIYVSGNPLEAKIDGTNPEEYKADYIYTQSSAEKLARVLKSRQSYSNYTFTINSKESFPVGAVANLTDTKTGISLNVLITSKTETDGNPIISYSARSISALTEVVSPVLSRISLSSAPSGNVEIRTLIDNSVTLLTADIESLESNVSSISTQVQNQSSSITSINGTLQTQASAISNHTSQISSLSNQISAIEGVDEGWQAFSETINQNALNISNLTSRVDDAEENITTANTTLATHQTNLTNQLASINSLTTSVGTINGSITTIQGRLNTAEGYISSQGTQLSGIATRLTSAETSLGSHTTQLTNHQNALNEQADDISTLDSSLTIEKGKIASLATKVTNIEGVNTSQATSITQNANAISTLATRVTSVEGVNTTQGTAITQNANSISSLASRVTTAEGTISNQATLITQNADEISSLATSVNTDISDLEEAVDNQSTLITQNAGAITSLANRTTTVEGTVANHTTQITQTANGLSSLAGRVTTAEGIISNQSTLIIQNADEISSLATSVNESLEDIEGSIDSQSTLITQNAGNISSLATRVTATEGTVANHTTLITQNADEISSLATSTTSSINALEGTVANQSTLITQNAGSISSLATRVTTTESSILGLEETVDEQSTLITQNAGSISSLATRVTSVEGVNTSQATSITQNAGAISSLATRVSSVEGVNTSQATSITQNAGAISSLATRVSTTENSISGLEETVDEQSTLITQNADEISSLATRTTTAEGTISNHTTSITQNTGAISSLATRVSSAEGTVASHTTSITQNAGAITSLANRTTTVEGTVASHTTSINQNADEINSLATRVSSAEGNITNVGTLVSQNADEISSLATSIVNIEAINTSQATSITQNAGAITSLANRVTTAEGTISTHSSSITQNANAIATKVTQAQVDTSIANAKSTNYGYRYAKDIIVYGESGKYYPVVIKGGNQNVKRDILVMRGYSEQAPSDWYTSTHKGGLTLKIKTNFGGWGGANYSWEIHELEELYSRTFAGAVNCGNNVMFAIFLRGGGTTGAVYHIYSDQDLTSTIYNDNGNIPASPQIAYNQDLIFKSGTYLAYAPVYRTITPAVEEEIRIRKFITLSQSNNTRLNSAETAITQTADSVTSLATRVTSVEGGVASNNTLITQTADSLSSLATRVSSVEGVNTSQATSITQNANSISSLATATTSSINALQNSVASHSTLITQNADRIDSIASRTTATEDSIDNLNTSVSQTATDLTSLAGRVTTTESSISSLGTSVSQNAGSITSIASRVTTTENLITSNTSSISQNADAIALKVEAVDTNGNSITGTKIEIGSVDGAGQIKLDADKILLDGSVKAGKIDTDDLFAKELIIKTGGSIKSLDGRVSITAGGSITAQDATLINATITGTGTFSGDITNPIFRIEKGYLGASYSFPSPVGWDSYWLYQALTNVPEFDTSTNQSSLNYNLGYSSSVVCNGTWGSRTITRAVKLNGHGSKGMYAWDGLMLWFSDGTYQLLGYSGGEYGYTYTGAISITSPNSYTAPLLYRSGKDILALFADKPKGVEIGASGTMTVYQRTSYVKYGPAETKTVISVIPYDNYLRVRFYGGTYKDYRDEIPGPDYSTYYFSWTKDSGDITLIGKYDIVEATTITPKTSTTDIGTETNKFRDGWFSGRVWGAVFN